MTSPGRRGHANMEGDLAVEEGKYFQGSTPKVRGGGVGGASGLVLYAVVFVLRGIILEFLIRDSRIVGLSISTRQRTKKR